jgi:hypothetical protein
MPHPRKKKKMDGLSKVGGGHNSSGENLSSFKKNSLEDSGHIYLEASCAINVNNANVH